EERWVFGDVNTVCYAAFYNDTPPGEHSLYRAAVDAMVGDDKVSEAKLTRDKLRITLRRERYCVLHNCAPPLSPPLTTFTICDDGVTVDRDAALRAMVSYVPALAGHDDAMISLGIHPMAVEYRRSGDAGDEVTVTIATTA